MYWLILIELYVNYTPFQSVYAYFFTQSHWTVWYIGSNGKNIYSYEEIFYWNANNIENLPKITDFKNWFTGFEID